MTKEEKIQEAWIEMQSHIESEGIPNYNEDGWAKYGGKQKSEYFKTLEEKQWLGYFFYRPKSLQGIEKNNGWIKIEIEEDLPKKEGIFYVYDGLNVTTAFYKYYSKDFQFVEGIVARPTHYQPIIKPQQPIY